uniref:Putative secreted protein n=1 Tax=Anopheles triannulatus TaxID=58253 RepID=A0A2M4B0K4_9DIPT
MMLLKLLNVFPVLEAEPGFGSLHSTLPIFLWSVCGRPENHLHRVTMARGRSHHPRLPCISENAAPAYHLELTGAALHPAGLVAAIISRGSGVEVVPGDADDQQQQQQNTL